MCRKAIALRKAPCLPAYARATTVQGSMRRKRRRCKPMKGSRSRRGSCRRWRRSHKRASLDAERATALYQEKALTKPDYDAARAQLDSTRAQVEAARKNVEAQRNLLESAKAQERSSTITFEDTALVAPMAAVVLEKRVEPGTLVGRGTAAFRLGDLSTVRMAFSVPDTLVSD